ncbi:MAG: class I SAM-dependent methyltransferase [Alphaproteobacteria bacterium]|nr:class I SAM-dependent methyltransferase [Alphaproteobacteria bacterium]
MIDETQRVLDTLFYPFQSGEIAVPLAGARVLFLNAQFHPALEMFLKPDLLLQQYFKPYAHRLAAAGFTGLEDDGRGAGGDEKETLDMVLAVLPKNRIEAEYLLARAMMALKPGGVLVAAADNRAGGGRLEKTLAGFGLAALRSEPRNKCRRVSGIKNAWAAKEFIDIWGKAQSAGAPQMVLGGDFQSWPGLFGWDKIDKGSEILLRHLPDDLYGRGADFGCGYGYLSRHVAQQARVESLLCIDADSRALRMCRENTQAQMRDGGPQIEFLWVDLCQPNRAIGNLDFIVMNPPFHEGRAADAGIGEGFIATAAVALKKGGRLFMVANRQLGYERAIEGLFTKSAKPFEGQGFKVIEAVK